MSFKFKFDVPCSTVEAGDHEIGDVVEFGSRQRIAELTGAKLGHEVKEKAKRERHDPEPETDVVVEATVPQE